MALPLTHTFSAKSLQAEMLAGKYNKLRFFQFGGMQAPSVGHQPSPTYTQHNGAMTYTPFGGQPAHTWFNATFSAAIPPVCEHHRSAFYRHLRSLGEENAEITLISAFFEPK